MITEIKETALPQINGTLVPRGQISIACKQITHRKAMAKKTNLYNLYQDRSGQTDVKKR